MKNLLITGANGYIGKGLVNMLDKTYNIIGIDKNKSNISNYDNVQCLDMTKENDINYLYDYLLDADIKLDGIVHAAGVNTMSNFYDIQEKQWNTTFDVNVKAFLFMLKILYPIFSEKMSIVTVASQNGVVAHEDRIAYGASKAALIQLVKNLSIDFLKDKSKDIKINSVSPSYVINESNEAFFDTVQGKKLIKKIPYNKLVNINDVCNAIEFLLSDKSEAIRGQNIIIDYGYTIV
ncbi:SDR family NAD(P)-dependent oxidoreductase [Bacillus spizizenii]|uniref:SDR family oxidoreductase n=1 Tax=Bacillus spizizenii TaxID=96241 RepID=UPI0005F044E9|nr:SDR family oxidoreductase [Bacillus spizizenii]MCY7810428.1 SDR family oxidoreductase [Bacillus spizizenii]MCY7880652.1 SDR family oxidoreductase [Bacillus spizizenii]MCY7888663.1 SDR family oxidoreductase [Bacillus spizizenii]MCY7932562.1 SDR family oxidoreductase [Bacillus spizizenii]MCY7970442.1 SDR family oxidoreductase [Bacillus spizizenii]